MKKVLLTVFACAAVCACNKEMISDITPEQKTFDGDVAYIVVNINDVPNTGTRASDGGFEYGSASEYAINDAHFYFYGGSDSEFVAEATYVPGGEAQEGTPVGNIEWKGNTVVALHGLSGTSYPNWVVTVLNKPAGFTAPNKLADFGTALAENNDSGIGTPGEYGIYTKGSVEIIGDSGTGGVLNKDGTVYYTMCTSSYSDASTGTTHSDVFYYATPVVEANFALEELTEKGGVYYDADGEEVPPITIYVERLVAKARVGLGSDLASSGFVADDGKTYYEIKVAEEIDGVVNENVSLYVRLEGWELNGVSNNTYMAKRIDTNWSLAFSWNDATNFRSYWAMSTAYGDANPTIWPDSSEGNDYDGAKNMNPYLRWFDLDPDYLHQIGVINSAGDYDYEYCGENTNTAQGTSNTGVINSKRHTALTNALVSATVGEFDANGEFVPGEFVRVNGVLYTKDNYRVYAASHIYLYIEGINDDGDTVYTQIGPDYLEIVNETDGYVHIELDREALGYVYNDGSWGYGPGTITIYKDTDGTEATVQEANEYIDEHFNAIYGYMANGYTTGMMYYSIPIQHLDNTEMKEDEKGIEVPYEGSYGVVRNHIYSITITAIENIGWGVFDPYEVIIPQEDVDTYSLTAQINILSWKLVEQSTVL